MKTLKEFQRKFSLRENQSLTSAKTHKSSAITLPEASALHYRGDSQLERGIQGSNVLVRNFSNRIRVFHDTENYGDLGSPNKKPFQEKREVSLYFRQQRRMSRVPKLSRVLTVERDLLVFDYTFFNQMYRYRESIWNRSYEWQNSFDAMTTRINEVGDQRHHFIHVQMPDILPEQQAFRKTDELRPVDLEKLGDQSQLTLRHLYAYMDNEGPFTAINNPEDVTICLVQGDDVMFLNLGVLKSLAEKDGQAVKFYALLTRVVELRTVADTDALEDVPEEKDAPEIPRSPVEQQVAALAQSGALTAGEQKRLLTLDAKIGDVVDPGTGKSLGETARITKEDVKIKSARPNTVNKNVIQESSTGSTVSNLSKDYVEKLMDADMVNSITSIRDAGYIIKGYESTDVVDAMNNYREVKFSIVPLQGKATTLTVRIPNVEDDGTFIIDGVRSTMDLQRVDIPIRKAGVDKVALTSYYGKLFVTRSDKAVNSFTRWVIGKLTVIGLDADDKRVTDVQFGGQDVPKEQLPRTYTALLTGVTSFKSNGNEYFFAYTDREERYGADKVKAAEKNGHVVCGKAGSMLITMNRKNVFHTFDGSKYHEHGTIASILDMDFGSIPMDVAEIGVMSKKVPITVMLMFYKGLTKFLRQVKVPYRFVAAGKRVDLDDHELRVRFKDTNLILNLSNPKHMMLMSGFRSVGKVTNQYNATDMDKRGGSIALLDDLGIKGHVVNELDLLQQMFVDPITEELLVDMGEPKTLEGLIDRSAELLLTDNHPDETDPKFMRLRGLERFSGMTYLSLVEAIRAHKSKPGRASLGLEMPPNEVWRRIITDPTVQVVEDTNPIQSLKEQEAVSLTGEGGRSARTLVARTRVFHEGDLGVISESSPDSAKVGIKTYLSPNANITSLRGTMGGFDKNSPISSVMSSTAQVMPAAHHDDGKRIVLASVQQAAVVPCAGYQSNPFRTGAESVVASRAGAKFSFVAKEDGVVDSLSSRGMKVKYKSGKDEGIQLGTMHGSKSGDYFPMEMITDRDEGYKFKAGEVLAWNKAFFERDMFSLTNVSMKIGALARVAVLESNDTHEDSSAISPKLSGMLNTTITKRKTLIVNFDQDISNLVSIGDELSYDSILGTISSGSLNDIEHTSQSIAALTELANSSPKGKFSGTVTNMEVFYIGDKEEMSDSLQKVVAADSRRRSEIRKAVGTKVAATGKLSKQTNIGGEHLLPNTVAISVYIDMPNDSGDGDKGVLANQLKTIHKRVFQGTHLCSDGVPIDMYFGARSIQARIVESVFIIGTMNTTLIAGSNRMADIYFGSE